MIDHEPYEELISAKLTGDLSEAEQRRLDSHLAGCSRCRDTMAAFTDGRRLVSGLRHLTPPRDLDARVRTGIERGAFVQLPWWRRPAAIFTGAAGAAAVVAGALIGIALLDQREPPVAQSTIPSPSAALSVSPAPSETGMTPEPTTTPVASPSPFPAAAIPTSYLALTGPADNLALHLRDGTSGDPIRALQSSEAPIAAALSPDGDWLAYITGPDGNGNVRFWLAEPSDGGSQPAALGTSQFGSPFMKHLAWSPDGRHLAFTVMDGQGASDVRIVDTDSPEPVPEQLTAIGTGVVGSFDPDGNLWISSATADPTSYRLPADIVGVQTGLVEPETAADAVLEGWFQPLVSPDGTKAIAWRGTMGGPDMSFAQGGFPYLLPNFSGGDPAGSEVALFGDVSIGREAFGSAAIAWGIDSDALAVWNVDWRGTPQSPDGQAYPDPLRVYLGRASEDQPINATRALDRADIPSGAQRIEDVAIAPDGTHLAVTVNFGRGGQDAPRAVLLLVERNTGETADRVEQATGTSDAEGWFGPAIYPR